MKHLSHTSPLTSHPLGAVHCCSISQAPCISIPFKVHTSWQFNSLGIDMNSQGSQGVYSIQVQFMWTDLSSQILIGSHEFGVSAIAPQFMSSCSASSQSHSPHIMHTWLILFFLWMDISQHTNISAWPTCDNLYFLGWPLNNKGLAWMYRKDTSM